MKSIYLDQVNKPNLTWLIQEFVYNQQHPRSSACDIPNLPPFYEKITPHTTAVATFHTPSDLSGIGGMKCKQIYTVNHWRKGPGHYDTLFVSATSDNPEDPSTHGFLGFEVARAHLFFSFTLHGVK